MRTILISGASRGIGKSIAERALEDGHRISLGVRNPNDLKGTKLDPLISGDDKVLINKYEAKDSASARDWVNKTIEQFDSFDSVIHCSGIFYKTDLFLYKKFVFKKQFKL